jgi:predicted transcriptional regulator
MIVNPFLQNFKINVIKVRKSFKEARTSDVERYMDGDSGINFVKDAKDVTETYLVEQQKKVSVFYIPHIENILYGVMKNAGRDLLLYVIYNIKEKQDWIDLKVDKIRSEMGISRATYYSAISQLIDVGIICKKIKSEYWVNPIYIFKGNRLEFYKDIQDDVIRVVSEISKAEIDNNKKG